MRTVLIADTDVFLTRIYAAYLAREGFAVMANHDGASAWQMLQSHVVDLAMLEIALPKLDGLTILSKLRSVYSVKPLPVVFFTNLASQDHIERALHLGANDYIVKAHYTPREVVDRLKFILLA
jgi:DNA-binding response OmpR family regulator